VVKPPIPISEWQRWEMQRTIRELGEQIELEARDLDRARQFRRDFALLAHAMNELDWQKPPKPYRNPLLPPYRTHPLPRRLPIGPLKRMAKLIGPEALRYVLDLGSETGSEFFRLILRPRLDKEYPEGNEFKRYRHHANIVRLGNAVLSFERAARVSRSEALEAAAQAVGVTGSLRTLERYFREFREHCLNCGYVPHPQQELGALPQFSLCDLDGRSPDKP